MRSAGKALSAVAFREAEGKCRGGGERAEKGERKSGPGQRRERAGVTESGNREDQGEAWPDGVKKAARWVKAG